MYQAIRILDGSSLKYDYESGRGRGRGRDYEPTFQLCADDLGLDDGLIDALWVFAGYPNSAVIQAASAKKIKLLQTYAEAKKGGKLFEDFPFYSKVVIPADTYPGVDYDVITIQDSALWTAGRHVPEELVQKAAEMIYAPNGLKYLVSVKSTAKAMSIDSGLTGIVTPVHNGAQNFWKAKGKTLTAEQSRQNALRSFRVDQQGEQYPMNASPYY